ncbi:MAG: 16S rRNA (guanine(527)-N(7))-methyltransferase RsmG [Bacillota bacterium]|nr:16S rRNA (guanine(527)-N(7))-methyltransferase RsmG [Bacillota bacterium]
MTTEITPEAESRLEAFLELVLEKNKVMNLTAVSDKNEARTRHLEDSLTLLQAADFKGKKIIDVGCGAGFPGMPLKLLDPCLDITLLDSQNKKIEFLKEAGEKLGVFPRLLCARAEEAAYLPELRGKFDIALARAVAPLGILCELTMPFLRQGGVFLAMKMKDSEEELKSAMNAVKTLGGTVDGFYDYTLAGEEIGRRIIIIAKSGDTPKIFPRRFSKIKSKPL